MKANHYLFVFIFTVIFNACSKQGPIGPAGTNGVANIYTNSYVIELGDWTEHTKTSWYANTNQNVPLEDLAVVYYSLNDSTFNPLPAYSVFYTNDFLTFSFSNTKDLTLWYYSSTTAPNPTFFINVVDIPPALQNKYPNTDWQNASEVQKIPEVQAALNNANNK